RRHTRSKRDWSSDVCSSDLARADALAFLYIIKRLNYVLSYMNFFINTIYSRYQINVKTERCVRSENIERLGSYHRNRLISWITNKNFCIYSCSSRRYLDVS